MYTYIYIHVYICMYIYIYMFIHVCVCACVCIYPSIFMHIPHRTLNPKPQGLMLDPYAKTVPLPAWDTPYH